MSIDIIGFGAAGVSAGLHIFIFYLESIVWIGPLAAKIFGLTPETASKTRELAFNQGFYNLFLANVTLIGIAMSLMGQPLVGRTLMLVGTGVMLAAAVVLFLSSPDKRSTACKQGLFPLLAIVMLAAGTAT